MQTARNLTNRFLALLANPKAFYAIMVLFVFESLWTALSSVYPMAFDEQQHFGVIQLHAKTLSPFLHNVGAETSTYGAIARDPSFLYHYLMSFPYRLIELFTGNQTTQVIILRLLNIVLVGVGLIIFRRLLNRLGTSWLRQNVLFFCFILLPIFPLMAGQISYDNLIFVLAATVLLLGTVFLQQHRSDGTINASILIWLIIICLLASTVKYAFLPVFAATILCLLVVIGRNLRPTGAALADWWRTTATWHKLLLAMLFIAGGILFTGSYGINVVRYHNPIPSCDKVLSIQACQSYAPWERDYISSLSHPHVTLADMPTYTLGWINQMIRETFFEIGSTYQGGIVVYFTKPPLPAIHIIAWILLIIGLIAVIWDARLIWRNPAYRLTFIVLALYTAALYMTNVQGYLRSGNPVAIHGRYLVPIMVPVIAIAGNSALRLVRRLGAKLPNWGQLFYAWRGVLLAVLMLFWLQGGLVSFVLAADDTWLWNSAAVRHINHVARDAMQPFVIR